VSDAFLERARRIAVRAQLLDGSATSVLDTVRKLGFLQMDPIATVAMPQHLVLYSRLGPYDAAELDRLLWEERKLFEYDAFIWPIEDLPLVRARMARRRRANKLARDRWIRDFLRDERALPAPSCCGSSTGTARCSRVSSRQTSCPIARTTAGGAAGKCD
jgi:uncharacterized protein YcaQ